MTESEMCISNLNSTFFFKEFTFSKNKFKTDKKGEELELADNVVWLDDLLLISQIKERGLIKKGGGVEESIKWFENKVLKQAVKQIKSSVTYFKLYDKMEIENEKGHILKISEAKKLNPIKMIIFSPGNNFPESCRFQKFYESDQVGLIHLFHIEDYLLICECLITPFEIKEYLNFREWLFSVHKNDLNQLSEKYVLGHYIEAPMKSGLVPRYVDNVSKLIQNIDDFDISFIIENFQEHILSASGGIDYYPIIKEFAKLNRVDLREFKTRLELVKKFAGKPEFTKPFRMVSLKSMCGFVFVPIRFQDRDKWRTAICNFTEAHKYDSKLDKTVGVTICYSEKEKFFDINWAFLNRKWFYDEEWDELLKRDNPFRPQSVRVEPVYFVGGGSGV